MQVLTADQAARLIKDEWSLTVGGFGHCGAPEALIAALERRFLSTGLPRRLSLMFASGAGDRAQAGLNRLAHQGLLQRIVGGFWSLAPQLGRMVAANQIEAHSWPQGVVSHMFRTIAAGRPGLISDVGLGTYVDPTQDGGCLNALTEVPLVERVEVAGRISLMYCAMPLHCALLRGTRADASGNVSMEREANLQDVLAQAQAVRNSGGIVIVQVMEVCGAGSIPANLVKIPGALVDYVVVAGGEEHRQTYGEPYSPAFTGEWARGWYLPHDTATAAPTAAKQIIGRRALHELKTVAAAQRRVRPLLVNLGIGAPEQIARLASVHGTLNSPDYTLTVESGAIGGRPAGGMSFGATAYPEAVISQAELFDLYDGGGIDISFLGFGEIDRCGRINVASLGDRLNGVGGFINISQAARQLVFCGSFTAGGLQVDVDSRRQLQITQEGTIRKLVKQVGRICYDPAGRARCRTPLVITERAVMRLSHTGLEVTEIAPGVDLQRDVLEQAGFALTVSPGLRPMPATVFSSGEVTTEFVS
jgi:propionate CoA-transferase